MQLNDEQRAMLAGEQGLARQMAIRLVLDLAAAANATKLIPIQSAHLSGVSPLTGGLGLRLFLQKLAQDPLAQVAVPTTLNAAGCDLEQFDLMRIALPDFKAHSEEIVAAYTRLGVRPTQSCTPYEWEDVVVTGHAAWAESNAICFGNSYTGLLTNRESGLSALASALTGYTPSYGLLDEANRHPNLVVIVTTKLSDPTDFSILGDWIGTQRKASWKMPYGPIPLIKGLPADLSHEQKKALTAAAANYGCPLLYLDNAGPRPPAQFEDRLMFGERELQARYEALRPRSAPSLIVIGCPQASVGEIKAVAEQLRGQQVETVPLWVFTSSQNKTIAEKLGLADLIRQSGALLLENTCPEVVPYDPTWVKHILTNSMKAEHYIKSGLNGLPTSVMRLADCVAIATGQVSIRHDQPDVKPAAAPKKSSIVNRQSSILPATASGVETFRGSGLPSQGDFTLTGEAFVTDAPITFLGFVNRDTGVIEEEGHPANGQSMAGKIAIFPKGSGSTVAPYVLLELYYKAVAPLAIVNTELDQQSAPACSLEGIPYAYGFAPELLQTIRSGDWVEIQRRGEQVTIRRLED
jgi:predicted aconitase/predicted aconitase with swiveling domain